MLDRNIPICPLMSAGNDIPVVCNQEKCAWYMLSLKKCAVYLIGHNAVLDLKNKVDKKEELEK